MERIICDREKCTGCFTCMNICPQNAIVVSLDECGKTIPMVKEKECVDCGLCSARCPSNALFKGYIPYKCYAAQWKSESRKLCSSGGIATGIYEYCLENNIHAFGCLFDNHMNLIIRELRNHDDVKKATGSKYIQSSVGLVYREVKKLIDNNERVVFIGTPCQLDGLYHFLGTRPDKLIGIDLVCHGTPPAIYFKNYLDSLGIKNCSSATFRGKNDYNLCLYCGENLVYKKWQKRDLYYQAYNEGILNRDNCYACRYATSERVSDITIGDFWGLDHSTLKSNMQGKVSLVLLNTDKGLEFWNQVGNEFVYEERLVREAVDGNPHLHKCIEKKDLVTIFEENYKKSGFKKALLKTGIRKRMLRIAMRKIKARVIKISALNNMASK